jgi:DnaJ-class molecular chaperone
MEAKPSFKDYYYVLGISSEATSEEIQEAYRELSDKYGPHVTMHAQDPESMLKTFRDITEAYDVLIDPEKRREYDQQNLPHLQKSHLRQLWGKLTGTDPNRDGKSTSDAAETTMEVEVSLKEAFKGTHKVMRIEEQLPCQQCHTLKPMQRLACQGCRGTGSLYNVRNEDIELPAGLYDKMEVRRPGLGKHDLRVHKNGELVLQIKVKPHQFFSLIGRDVSCTVPVTILEAVLGGEIEVPTLTGKVIMKIMPLTQTGRVYRLKGMGLGGADLLATIEVVVPTQISADEVILFRKINDISTIKNPREELFAKLNQMPQ